MSYVNDGDSVTLSTEFTTFSGRELIKLENTTENKTYIEILKRTGVMATLEFGPGLVQYLAKKPDDSLRDQAGVVTATPVIEED
jgi:hypothetical protein